MWDGLFGFTNAKGDEMDETLERNIGQLLLQKALTLAAAESCTGGLIGHRVTNIPGSSEYYLGSVTAYAYEAKVRLLGVQWDTLNKYGAVSDETVAEMARGVAPGRWMPISVFL